MGDDFNAGYLTGWAECAAELLRRRTRLFHPTGHAVDAVLVNHVRELAVLPEKAKVQ
ncbi:hypothetical protein [Agromyces sp. NBRC 114283]|uniref:hypothetical protein n=1 Tax=Agromyces sp. NBRC 114283 TaxID=2994521 RepID=UPI0024A2704F|nr:hypothetical protein [Agromyces sp. NBRC 114283]GLU88893.1 hypothetical protein Agsp01_11480 [Agromyces sp. NBRC 114283]